MPNPLRRSVSAGTSLLVPVLLLCLFSFTASEAFAQDAPAPFPFQKQLDRMDLAVSVTGVINSDVNGTEQRDATSTHNNLAISPSSTVGELITLRYTAKPYVGFEYNFGNFRNAQNYTYTPKLPSNQLTSAQAGVHEITLGYVVHPRKIFGVQPYLGVGGGTIHFTPTSGGGEGLPFQYRAVYYYSFGVEQSFPSSHFGVRAGFRQLIYLAPDFGENYLTITRRMRTSEPTFGFFARF
jgi:hypothetical protein